MSVIHHFILVIALSIPFSFIETFFLNQILQHGRVEINPFFSECIRLQFPPDRKHGQHEATIHRMRDLEE